MTRATTDSIAVAATHDGAMTPMPTIVLVHGAWHGPWNWEKVENELNAAGWLVRAVELPSVARTAGPRFGLHDDAEVVRQHIADIDGPVVIAAHSYGGVATTEGAADLPNVRHIMYLAAFQLDIGESVLSACSGKPPQWWDINGDTVTPRNPGDVFYADLAPEDSDRAIAHLRPQSLVAFTERLEAAAWRTVPSTYVVCEQDRAIPVAAQDQMSARATNTRRLSSSHSPFLSMPGEVARLIADVASQRDSLLDLDVLTDPVRNLRISMKDGTIYKS
jgi:pimeloyl-ACP methyl ester carboxylesterase